MVTKRREVWAKKIHARYKTRAGYKVEELINRQVQKGALDGSNTKNGSQISLNIKTFRKKEELDLISAVRMFGCLH